MTQKKRTTIWIDPHVLKSLKFMGVEHDQPIGNVIEALVDFVGSSDAIRDEDFRRRFKALLNAAFANAGRRGTMDGAPQHEAFEVGQGPDGDDIEP